MTRLAYREEHKFIKYNRVLIEAYRQRQPERETDRQTDTKIQTDRQTKTDKEAERE